YGCSQGMERWSPVWNTAIFGDTVAFQQLYTPAAQRRVVRRATPATLTGVKGRPTLAWAGEIRLNELMPVRSFAASDPTTPMIAASSAIFSFLDKVISLLLSCNSRAGRSFP